MDVEHPELARAGVPEPVNDADWRGDVRSRASNYGPTADDELGLALEHVEGVDLVCVTVWFDAFEFGPEMELYHLELRQFGEDPMEARAALGLLALPRANGDSVHSPTVSVRPAAEVEAPSPRAPAPRLTPWSMTRSRPRARSGIHSTFVNNRVCRTSMRSAGFEPATLGFEARCSIQLSYERGGPTIPDLAPGEKRTRGAPCMGHAALLY